MLLTQGFGCLRITDDGAGSTDPFHQTFQIRATVQWWPLFTNFNTLSIERNRFWKKVEEIVDVNNNRNR
jgi:hypothetical protein